MKRLIIFIMLGIIPPMLGGCASIVSKSNQTVTISTEPDNAEVVIKNAKGRTIHKGKTPTTITLSKSDGSYFGGETYSVYINKKGYSSKSLVIDSKVNNWYIFGNLGFGGLIGWFIVDPSTGAMYKLEPNDIYEELSKK